MNTPRLHVIKVFLSLAVLDKLIPGPGLKPSLNLSLCVKPLNDGYCYQCGETDEHTFAD